MAGDWAETTLGDVASFDSGHRNSQDAVENGIYPFFTCSQEILRHSEFDFDTEAVIMAGNNAEARFHLQYYNGRFAARQRTYIITPITPTLDCRFLYYALHGLQPLFKAQAQGTTTKFVTIGILRNAPLNIPAIDEQRAIAHILGTLDDKIELNRRMSETLEAMARALFKSWFVDFDPVRAKAEGRDPGLPRPLADLFPDSFENSELGEIPKGWEVRGLDEIARFLNGLALQKYPAGEGASLPVIKIAQLRAGDTAGADRASIDLPADYVVDDGDVLFSWSGSLEVVLWAAGKGALNQHLFKVTSAEFPKWFYYLWIRQHLSNFRRIAAAKATTMGHIQRHHLSEARVVVPPRDSLVATNQILAPLIDALPTLRVESRSLGLLRDELLPKLVSGEMRVANPSAFIGKRL